MQRQTVTYKTERQYQFCEPESPNLLLEERRADSGAVEVGHVASDARIHDRRPGRHVVEAERVSKFMRAQQRTLIGLTIERRIEHDNGLAWFWFLLTPTRLDDQG